MRSPSDGFWEKTRVHVRTFFTNWSTYDAPFFTKVGLTFRNRTKAFVTLRGCCGNRGEPGC